MAANLALVMDDTDKVRGLRDDALAQGLAVLPPDVNASNYRFEPVDAKRIRYGLGGIKGTGEQAIASIVAAREADGPFRDLFDFCRRVDKRLVNRRVVEALIKAGAFDAIDARRATLYASVGVALAEAERAEARRRRCRCSPKSTRPRCRSSRRASGPTRSGSSTRRRRSATTFPGTLPDAAELAPLVRTPLASLQPKTRGGLVAGIVTGCASQSSRRGKMAFVTLDDGGGSAEVVVFNETFDAARSLLREDLLVIVEAKIPPRIADDGQKKGLRIVADAVYDLAAIRGATRRGCASRATAARRRAAGRADRAVPPRLRARSSSSTATAASSARSSCPKRGA